MRNQVGAERPSTFTTERRQPDVHTQPEKMRKSTRVFLGVLSLIPLLGAVATMIFLGVRPAEGWEADQMSAGAGAAIPYAFLFATFLLVLFFGAYVMNNRRLSAPGKLTWLAGFLVFSVFTLPLYWYVHIWPVRRDRFA